MYSLLVHSNGALTFVGYAPENESVDRVNMFRQQPTKDELSVIMGRCAPQCEIFLFAASIETISKFALNNFSVPYLFDDNHRMNSMIMRRPTTPGHTSGISATFMSVDVCKRIALKYGGQVFSREDYMLSAFVWTPITSPKYALRGFDAAVAWGIFECLERKTKYVVNPLILRSLEDEMVDREAALHGVEVSKI